ncbi:MAG: hypothetical protein U0514_01385 [Candidatus Andersenbacteria bacterium]
MKPALLAVLAAFTVLLSGCTWFQAANQPQNATNQTSSNQPSSINAQSTPGTSVSTQTLSKPGLGFSVHYPATLSVHEGTACVEGCPAGLQAPFFGFSSASIDTEVALVAFSTEKQMLQQMSSSATSVEGYVHSSAVQLTSTTKLEHGVRYDYIRPGMPAPASPGLYGNQGTPDQVSVAFVRDDGRVYDFSHQKDRGTADFQVVVGSFSFL